ncbi:MAG TPA: leucyl/phenylalanyl-tRNA--protein transferase [Microthrixaceae bacterium]|nr:leucyl/phenylalanyl-tRNA--protein transferase [Microthrixaceae bacterium]
MPVEPEPSAWVFPPVHGADPDGPVAIGGDLLPGTLLMAYRNGLFPMPIGRRRLGWFSPDPRGVLIPTDAHLSRSLVRSMRQFEFRVDTAFAEVVEGCADPSRPHGWISADIKAAYGRMHQLGWAHSVETFFEGELVGGLYGISIGGLFAAESKFHRRTDASKAAVIALARIMSTRPGSLIDVQWATQHLETLGVSEMDRDRYVERSAEAQGLVCPDEFQDNRPIVLGL